jgi:hypothetical protein
MSDIRRQVGLDFRTGGLPSTSADRAAGKAAAGLAGAVLRYGKELLAAVGQAEPNPARLHDLVEQLRMPIDVALTVVSGLEEQGFLTVVERDLKGNHALRLTTAGASLLR